ncbi:conserved hypothetical protein [Neospora caninum Liverpool]|uniref:Elongation factor Tu GTP binding domain-containing protein n=1 Tax=Neospora caninum (strain Liverpool) TaxID=572307 RepID=F0VH83_NEOCL|nr:conserved hypothetical protein [Neospora caninum Liverpool]CBZ53077.1 conserved hypothetical protein [Neospora caninum Liverpool]|eukprot:XP_003883109.1 conserved hypothetical protein [Neospora caninum Liverpool]
MWIPHATAGARESSAVRSSRRQVSCLGGDNIRAKTVSRSTGSGAADAEEQKHSWDENTRLAEGARDSDSLDVKTRDASAGETDAQTPHAPCGTAEQTRGDAADRFETPRAPSTSVNSCDFFPPKMPRRELLLKGKRSRRLRNDDAVCSFDLSLKEEVRSLLKQTKSSRRQIVYPAEKDDGNVEYKLFLSQLSPTKLAHRTTQMRYRLQEGGGVCFYLLGVTDGGLGVGISARCMRESIEAVARMAASLSASMGVVDLERVAKDTEEQEEKETNTDREREETQTPGARASDGEAEKCYGRHEKEGDEGTEETRKERRLDWERILGTVDETNTARWIACVRVSQNAPTTAPDPSRGGALPAPSAESLGAQGAREIRVAVLGAHDAGKSSLVAVLAEEGTLDDGEGSARLRMCTHPHEVLLGATSALHFASLHPSPVPARARPQTVPNRHSSVASSSFASSSPFLSPVSPGRGIRHGSTVRTLPPSRAAGKTENGSKEGDKGDTGTPRASAASSPRSASSGVRTPPAQACDGSSLAVSLGESKDDADAKEARLGGTSPPTKAENEGRARNSGDAGNAATAITLMDMAGHPKYIKSALTGLLRECLDHVVIVIDASPEAAPIPVQLQQERVLLATSLVLLRLPFTLVFNKWERRADSGRARETAPGSSLASACQAAPSPVDGVEGGEAATASVGQPGDPVGTNVWGKQRTDETANNEDEEPAIKAQLCAEVVGNLQAMFCVAGAALVDCTPICAGQDVEETQARQRGAAETVEETAEEAKLESEDRGQTALAERQHDPSSSLSAPGGHDTSCESLPRQRNQRNRTGKAGSEDCAVLLRLQRRDEWRRRGRLRQAEERERHAGYKASASRGNAPAGAAALRFPLACRGAFCVSCVEGQGIEQLRRWLQQLPRWNPASGDEASASSGAARASAPHSVWPGSSSSLLVSKTSLRSTVHTSRGDGGDRGDGSDVLLRRAPSSSVRDSSSSVASACTPTPSASRSLATACASAASSFPSPSASASASPPIASPNAPASSAGASSCEAFSSRCSRPSPLSSACSLLPPCVRSAFLVTEVFPRCRAAAEQRDETLFSDNPSATTAVRPRPRSGGSASVFPDSRDDGAREENERAAQCASEEKVGERAIGAVLGGVLLQGRLNVGDHVLCGPFLAPSSSFSASTCSRSLCASSPASLVSPGRDEARRGEGSTARLPTRDERKEEHGRSVTRGKTVKTKVKEEDDQDEARMRKTHGGASFLWLQARIESLRDSERQSVSFLPDIATPMKCSLAAVFLPEVASLKDVSSPAVEIEELQKERREGEEGKGVAGTKGGEMDEWGLESSESREGAAVSSRLPRAFSLPVSGPRKDRERRGDVARTRGKEVEAASREEGRVRLLRPGLLLATEVLAILPLSASPKELAAATSSALARMHERRQFRSSRGASKGESQAQRRCQREREDEKEEEKRDKDGEEGREAETARRSRSRARRKKRSLRSLSEAATSPSGRVAPANVLAPFETGLVLLQFIGGLGGELLASGLPIVVCSGVDVQGIGDVVAPCPEIPFFSHRLLGSWKMQRTA